MREYIIATDSCSDLPESFLSKEGIISASLGYNMDGKVYGEGNLMDPKEFYDKMREGQMPTTSAVNPTTFEEKFRPYLESGKDVLYIGFSSGLSSTYSSGAVAAEALTEEFKDAKVITVDSLCASLGQGLLVYYANELKKEGKSIDEVAHWLEKNKLYLCHQFTVNDLMHLHRGGRVSKTTAIVGTLINVKPVLHVDDAGKLISLHNVRGRKKALNALVDNMEKTMGRFKDDNKVIFISHGDCEEDAVYVKNRIEEKFGKKEFLIDYVSPTIGAHAGPGVVALFFLGEKR